MKVLKFLYFLYTVLIFCLGFVVFMPAFIILIQNRKWHDTAISLNRIWAKTFFMAIFMPVKMVFHFKLEKDSQYIFCPNHTSYLDIPITGMIKHKFVFVGKNSLERIPFFGAMYRKLHITVDRESLRSRHNVLVKAMEAIDRGKSLLFFPEGGILTKTPPDLAPFKNGPFRLAIEKQVPIVPVTIPFNWMIFPDEQYLISWHRAMIIYHEPIATTGLTIDDLDWLKQKTFHIIESEIAKHNNRNAG